MGCWKDFRSIHSCGDGGGFLTIYKEEKKQYSSRSALFSEAATRGLE
jgi:hypothetical protein